MDLRGKGTNLGSTPQTAGSEPSEPEEPDSPWLTLTSNAVQALRRHVEHVFGAGLREEIFVPLSRATKEGADVLGFWREKDGWVDLNKNTSKHAGAVASQHLRHLGSWIRYL